jgi:outer membrane protein
MKMKSILLLALMSFAVAFQAQAQGKIGYANIELILSMMPETKQMGTSLQTYQTQLGKKLESKQKYYQQKLQELQLWAQETGVTSEEDPRIATKAEELGLQKLQQELQKEAAEADQKLAKRRADLMLPITEKLESTIKEVAETEGYDYIFNSVDSGGVSIVLHGPEDRDLTKVILGKLGIKLPSGEGK